jgi:phosphoserine phosphatase RsbU/P
VSNALKYGSIDTAVMLRTRGEGDLGVAIEVHNAGDAISPDTMAHMFEPMKRGVDATDQTARSIGLGLYIVKHIIDAHGGTIQVTSTEQGTTFAIRLPRLPRAG